VDELLLVLGGLHKRPKEAASLDERSGVFVCSFSGTPPGAGLVQKPS